MLISVNKPTAHTISNYADFVVSLHTFDMPVSMHYDFIQKY